MCKRQYFVDASHLLLWSTYPQKPYFIRHFPSFAYNNILVSMMKVVNSSYSWRISAKELLSCNANLGSLVLNPLSLLVILFSRLATRVTMYCDDEKDRLLMLKMASCGIFQQKSAIRRGVSFDWKLPQIVITKILQQYFVLFGIDSR